MIKNFFAELFRTCPYFSGRSSEGYCENIRLSSYSVRGEHVSPAQQCQSAPNSAR
ncbi:hypothetical protein ABIB68_007661 [Bradyrhizobium sp. F1.2.2]